MMADSRTPTKSEQLRAAVRQHAPKNTKSKTDDKRIYQAMTRCIDYLEQRLTEPLEGYHLEFQKHITFGEMIKLIGNQEFRKEFDRTFKDRTIKPDGGVIFLKKDDNPDYLKIVLISEVKRQGTNDARQAEGKPSQAQGNAVERLGKNLTGIKAALNHERVTPFVCFGWGCDFVENYDESAFVMSKISMLNEFYDLNKTYVFKRNGSADKNFFSPVSMYFREEQWEVDEMYDILKEVGETALRYYIY